MTEEQHKKQAKQMARKLGARAFAERRHLWVEYAPANVCWSVRSWQDAVACLQKLMEEDAA